MAKRRIIGSDFSGSGSGTGGANRIYASLHSAIYNGILTEFRNYSSSNGSGRPCIYDENDDLLHSESGSTTCVANQWNSTTLSSTVEVVQSTEYSLGLKASSTGVIRYNSDSGISAWYQNSTFADSFPDPATPISISGRDYMYQAYGYIPPTITSVNGGTSISDDDTSVPVVGTDFIDSAGDPTYYLCPTSTFANEVVQTTTTPGDITSYITVDATGLSAGVVYMFAVTALGQVSDPFAVTLTSAGPVDIEVDIEAPAPAPSTVFTAGQIATVNLSFGAAPAGCSVSIAQAVSASAVVPALPQEIEIEAVQVADVDAAITVSIPSAMGTIEQTAQANVEAIAQQPAADFEINQATEANEISITAAAVDPAGLFNIEQSAQAEITAPASTPSANFEITQVTEGNLVAISATVEPANSEFNISQYSEAQIDAVSSVALGGMDIEQSANASIIVPANAPNFEAAFEQAVDVIVDAVSSVVECEIEVSQSADAAIITVAPTPSAEFEIEQVSLTINVAIAAAVAEASSNFAIEQSSTADIDATAQYATVEVKINVGAGVLSPVVTLLFSRSSNTLIFERGSDTLIFRRS